VTFGALRVEVDQFVDVKVEDFLWGLAIKRLSIEKVLSS